MKELMKFKVTFNPDDVPPEDIPRLAKAYITQVARCERLCKHLSFAQVFSEGLLGQAHIWYNETFPMQDDVEEQEEPDKEVILMSFKQNFSVHDVTPEERYTKLCDLRMSGPWVTMLDNYVVQFNTLASTIASQYGRKTMTSQFLRGLHDDWVGKLTQFMDTSAADCDHFKMQAALRKNRIHWSHRKDRIRGGPPPSKKPKQGDPSERTHNPRTWNPQAKGRGDTDGKRTPQMMEWLKRDRRCFKCAKTGHPAGKCRSSRASNQEIGTMMEGHRKATEGS